MESNNTVTANISTPLQEQMTRSKFGTRYLTDPGSVFQHNAWDNAVWDEDQEAAAQKIVMNHAKHAASVDRKDEYERDAGRYWDQFYSIHSNHFFKDRHWLFTEFPELYGGEIWNNEFHVALLGTQKVGDDGENAGQSSSQASEFENSRICDFESVKQEKTIVPVSNGDSSSFRLLEVGCGVGNTVFPLIKTNKNPSLFVYCCDFSSRAIDIVKSHPDYEQERCQAFVCDITDDKYDVPFPVESLDIITMIFVLSAICPEKMQDVVRRLASYLKPGGVILFRDYGRYDMAQLRFKESRCLSESFYARGDGTVVYFFTQDELKAMFEQAGLIEKENIVDRRLQVNRCRQLKMYRVWIQCKYMKPLL